MKILLVLCSLLSSAAFASGSFDGKWAGQGTLITSSGTQNCNYTVYFGQPSADVTLQSIARYCDSSPSEMVSYSYSSSGSKVYDAAGNEVGEFANNVLHLIVTWSDGSVNGLLFQLKNDQLEYSQQLIRPNVPSQNFIAQAFLKKN